MKTSLIALASLAAFTLNPRPASALGDKEAAILGGILGGVIAGAVISDALHDGPDHLGPAVHVGVTYGAGHGSYDRHPGPDYRRHHDHDRGPAYGRDGYWTFRTVRVWVPRESYWTRDRWGNRVKHVSPARWEFRREKVWVPARGRY